jgi:hypothetical protein
MPDFHIVHDNQPLNFDDAKKAFSAEMREGLARAAARARIPEDDEFWALLVALTELLNTGQEAQAKLIKTVLDKFVSARSQDNQRLAALLEANAASSREIATSVSAAAKESQEAVAALQKELHQQRVDLEHVLSESVKKSDQQGRGVADIASSLVREVKWMKSASVTWFWSFVGLAFFLGSAMVFVIQHLVR